MRLSFNLLIASTISLASLSSIFAQNQATLVLSERPYITVQAPENAQRTDDSFDENFQAFSIEIDSSTTLNILAFSSNLLGLPQDLQSSQDFYNAITAMNEENEELSPQEQALQPKLEIVSTQNPNINFCLKGKSLDYTLSYFVGPNGDSEDEEIFIEASAAFYIAYTNKKNVIIIAAKSEKDFDSVEEALAYEPNENVIFLLNQALESLTEK